jgi:hypothetical protein
MIIFQVTVISVTLAQLNAFLLATFSLTINHLQYTSSVYSFVSNHFNNICLASFCPTVKSFHFCSRVKRSVCPSRAQEINRQFCCCHWTGIIATRMLPRTCNPLARQNDRKVTIFQTVLWSEQKALRCATSKPCEEWLLKQGKFCV